MRQALYARAAKDDPRHADLHFVQHGSKLRRPSPHSEGHPRVQNLVEERRNLVDERFAA